MGYPSNAVDWLTKLIGFNTVSRYSNLQLIEYVAGYCEQLGLSPRLTFNADNTKANLFVTVPAMGKGDTVLTGGFVFSGHTDVVPVDGQAWDTDPFVATIVEDKLYGRGACDMKGFIACALTLLPSVVQASRDKRLGKPIHLALSYDEEVGCLGAPLLLADLKAQGIKPDYCIVGEPTSAERFGDTVKNGRRGSLSAKLTVKGIQGHVAYPDKVRNPIHLAAPALAELAARTFHDTFAAENRPEDMAAHSAESYSPELQGREIADPEMTTLLVHEGDALVGFAQLRRGPAPDCVVDRAGIELWRFYLATAFHGRGVAQALMQRADEEARARGAATMWLGVWERNERAKAFYRKRGFTDVGAHVYMVGADAQTDRIMVRDVGPGNWDLPLTRLS